MTVVGVVVDAEACHSSVVAVVPLLHQVDIPYLDGRRIDRGQLLGHFECLFFYRALHILIIRNQVALFVVGEGVRIKSLWG